jgi:hypothetical protein
MKLMLSGEGPTDIGVNRPVAGGREFVPGPMAELLDKCCEGVLGYSLLELQRDNPGLDFVEYRDRGDLSQRKQQREGRPLLLRGLKRPTGLAGPQAQAWTLGRLAVDKAGVDQAPVVAVLFHDSDGTRSVPRSQWQDLVAAIEQGFMLADCQTGVAMVPRPKSEAWLLCALKTPPYQHCDHLEDAPGNDSSPNALKPRLAALNAGSYPSGEEQADWVRSGRIDPACIDMPSFLAFIDRLGKVLGHVTGRAVGQSCA